MIESKYFDNIYQIIGDTIEQKPKEIFVETEVYLIIDVYIKIIWIWAGRKSRLFQRYMAANWAGKLKSRNKFYDFKYEVIKQYTEPVEFLIIIDEINKDTIDLDYPGQSRTNLTTSRVNKPNKVKTNIIPDNQRYYNRTDKVLSQSEKKNIERLLAEIKEIKMHVKYSLDHISKRITEIENALE